MTSFLSKKKDEKTYEEKLATIPEQTRRNKMYAVKVFENFVKDFYESRSIQDVIEELQLLKKTKEQETYDIALYDMLQDWINWNESRRIGNYTIKVLFSNLRKYLFHVGIRTHEQDIKEFLRFGKRSKEERLSKFKKKEIKFLEYLDEKIENSCTYAIDYKDAINSGAEIADISVETTKRHLKRVISSEGKFRKHDYDDDRPSVLTKRDPPRGVKEKLSQNILWSWV